MGLALGCWTGFNDTASILTVRGTHPTSYFSDKLSITTYRIPLVLDQALLLEPVQISPDFHVWLASSSNHSPLARQFFIALFL
jgi:hypothetical protein